MSPGTTEELVKTDRELVLHPAGIVGQTLGWIVESGQGLMLKDTEGKEYMDFAAGLTCVNLGYGRKELGEVAMEAMSKLGYCNTFSGFSNKANVECAKKLKELTPDGVNHFFFASGGSDAVDSAIKTARVYWRQKGRGKYKIISLENSYHGVSMGVCGVTTIMGSYGSIGAEPIVPGYIHAPYYYCYRCPFGLEYPACDTRCARYLEEIIEMEGEETVAAFLGEPDQGSGGQIPPPPTYWPLVRKICTEHNVLLITDEVMTGFGRTGKMFCVEHWNLKPDMMCMAKGITNAFFPFSATGVSDEIYNTLAETSARPGPAYTYSGHPVGSAVAIKAMEIYEKEKLVENSAKVGKYMLDKLNKEFADLPHVGNIHGLGLFAGMDIVVDKKSKQKITPAIAGQIGAKCIEKGLMVRSYNHVTGLTPALTCTTQQVDWALSVLKPILADLKI